MDSKITQNILGQLDDLIEKSKTSGESLTSLHQFFTQSLAAIDGIAGAGSKYAELAHNAMHHPQAMVRPNHPLAAIAGIIMALRDDVADGYLTKLQVRIHADLFSDYLEMAEHLLAEDYLGSKDAAAVLAGGTLEEHLRQLCIKNKIPIEKSVETMNTKLRTADVYGLNEQKQVTAWYGLRNSAAHAKYDEYDKKDVALFLQGLRYFISKYPA